MKTAENLALFAEESLGTSYIYGTFGQILTERLLAEKARVYPERLSEKRVKYAREHYIGKRTTDCYGLIKRFKWCPGDHPGQNETPIYNAREDISANQAFERATVKGKISTMPDIRGICVRYSGHVGVYVGKDRAGVPWVVEARGFDYGTVKTKLHDRKWTDWFQESGIDYNSPAPVPGPGGDCEVNLPVLKKGSKGPEVFAVQSILIQKGVRDQDGKVLVADSSFGGRTDAAVKKFQKMNYPDCGEADGVVGQKTWTKLLKG